MAPERCSPETSTATITESAHSFGRLIAAGTLAAVCGGFIGGVYAAKTDTGIKIGPHNATAELTLAPEITIGLGPFGSATKPTGHEFGGVKIELNEIPASASESPLSTASATVHEYEQLLADPKHIKEAAVDTVVTRIWHDGVAGAAFFGPSSLVLLGLAGRKKRTQEQARRAARQTVGSLGDTISEDQRSALLGPLEPPKRTWPKLAGALAIGSLLATTAHADTPAPNKPAVSTQADQVLEGTPFEGYTLHGALLQLAVDQGGARLKQFIETNDTFYQQVVANFQETFAAQFQDMAPAHTGQILLLSISDNHCNLGMDPVFDAIAKAFGVKGVLDNGDSTMSGSMAEEECISAEADALKGYPILLAPGNHDNGDDGHGSTPVQDFAAKHGITVLKLGKMVDLAGLKVTGAPDPMQSTLGTPIHQHGSQSIADVATQLAAVAAAEHPDILMAHEPEMLTLAAEQGDVKLLIAGHTHTFSAPVETNENTGSMMMTEGTSGGVKKDTFTIGPLQQTSVTTVLAFDPITKRPVGYYLIQIQPDKAVSISDFLPINPIIVPPKLRNTN